MVNIAIIGFGVVGSGVYEVIRKNFESITRKAGTEINIKSIIDIRDFSDHPESGLFKKDFDAVLNDPEIDIVVEVMGGLDPAYSYTKAALEHKKSVVTSNKELVATHGDELLKIAYENNVKYLFEASVGGGIPIIRPLKLCLAANEITEIVGILNGTTNYILTQMIKEGKSFEEALLEAQQKGYAERNPAADVEGHDACRKICILSSLVFGKHIDYKEVSTEGITNLTLTDVEYADKMGYAIKLLGYSKLVDGKVDVRVAPMLVEKSHPLATVDDVFNGILVKGDAIGDAMFYGRGAGKLPTASAVVADIIDIAKNPGSENAVMWSRSAHSILLDPDESIAAFFVRVETADKPGTTANIKSVFGDVTILDMQDGELGFITAPVREGDIKAILTNLDNKVVSTLRILDE